MPETQIRGLRSTSTLFRNSYAAIPIPLICPIPGAHAPIEVGELPKGPLLLSLPQHMHGQLVGVSPFPKHIYDEQRGVSPTASDSAQYLRGELMTTTTASFFVVPGWEPEEEAEEGKEEEEEEEGE